MATTKNWMAKLQALDGAVVDHVDPFLKVVQSGSPSVNFTFGNTWGLPQGYTLALYGPPKGGKSVLANSMIGQLHKSDPEAWAVKYNTEFRELAQLRPDDYPIWGIDPSRYIAYQNNTPTGVFDHLVNDVAAQCQEGLPLKLVVIDSLSTIRGRRDMNSDTIETQQIGDQALTIQEGLKRILPVQRKYGFALVLVLQIRAEMDPMELRRHNAVKMAASFGVKHYAEYFMYVEENRNAEARTDLLGNELKDESLKDIRNKEGERIARKVRVCMKDSSMGTPGRCGEFTFNYNSGIINVHEEAFLLGVARGIIERPNQLSYAFGNKKWAGKAAMLDALQQDADLMKEILQALKNLDVESGKKNG